MVGETCRTGKVNCRVEFYKNYNLKLSRYAEEEERNAYAILRNRIKASQDSKRKVLSSIGEDMRTVSRDTELLRFRRATTRTEVWNRQEYDFSARNVVLDLNCNESAAVTDAHVKRYKFCTEDDIAAAQSFIDWRIPKCNIACERLLDVFNDRRNCDENATDIACDTTDDDCNGVDLITVFNYVMDAGCIDSIVCINSDADYSETSSRS